MSTPSVNVAFVQYCEAIFELDEDDVEVIQARIAHRLDVSRPAVSEMIRRLDLEGLVRTGKDGRITLTAEGRRLAEQAVRRHRLAERFLTDVLQLSWAEAHHEASRWEQVISEPIEAAMVRLLGDPTTCPHGNPSPGSDYAAPDSQLLKTVALGESFIVERIPEELEFTPGLLEFLEAASITPGHTGRVRAVSPDGTLTLEIGDAFIGVGPFVADRIMVRAVMEANAA